MIAQSLASGTLTPNSVADSRGADLCGPAAYATLDLMRLRATERLASARRSEMGQYLTPSPVARLMASMFRCEQPVVSILDAGAGTGSLFAALVLDLCARDSRPRAITVTAYEIEPGFYEILQDALRLCGEACHSAGIEFVGDVRGVDFIGDAGAMLNGDLFDSPRGAAYTAAILNPPYRKIRSDSGTRKRLREIGVETSNIYAGFVSTAIRLLDNGGELVAITPRSFCNGTYFRGFRSSFLRDMALRRIHLFDSREEAFRDDEVLQETIIVHAVKSLAPPESVAVSCSASAEDDAVLCRTLPYEQVVHPPDTERFIRVVPDEIGARVAERMARFKANLHDLGLTVSTGRVVDFRATEFLRASLEDGAVPLIHPTNLAGGKVCWPTETRKPQAIVVAERIADQLVPNDHYVLVKRFSSKEERRRVVAAVYDPRRISAPCIGFENHLNYFHQRGHGLEVDLAAGLATFLNSSLVDVYFRQFNGHTQVNAADLRSLPYPTYAQLVELGRKVPDAGFDQTALDELINREFFSMAEDQGRDPVAMKRRIEEARDVLQQLGLPRQQLNDRSALTLLALLNLGPETRWSHAKAPLMGITPIMEFMERRYGKRYAPNTRETVRRQTMHQFRDAGFVVANPDEPTRPTNAPGFAYQLEPDLLDLLRTFGTKAWPRNLRAYLASRETLARRYAQEREMARIPLEVRPGTAVSLSPGGQNVLVAQVVAEFAGRFTPGARAVYVGDTDDKFAYFDEVALAELGVRVDLHGKMPDVIIYDGDRDWLVLVEAVTSHGPVNAKRKTELEQLFAGCRAGLVFVTAFLTRKVLTQYLQEIAWETEVWVAEDPTHMIHFNGERFLGPY